ncbi:hypothetical protein A2J03_02620 [Rhodococcus sp. EPR-157]|uniref:GNAT family N-acetyltransferase n=1 Tax=Rhodococcus sp. EPR-157 TaxID=1813677 RepID=UPI0007BAE1D5|nr:GNAT family N-acetyltransferase [Rhodococcus sp. EPR-157]KZF09427.1 hypothetical protein A2J03_02620 [Rhodococcus sp. EPR-157]
MSRICDGAVHDLPGGTVVATGIPATGFNQLHLEADENSVLAAAEAIFDRRGVDWRIISHVNSAAAQQYSEHRGIERQPLYPVMAIPAATAVPPPSTALTFTTAGDVADLRAFVDCAAAGYRMDPAILKPIAHQRALADDSIRFHLGWIDGRCVAVSVGVRNESTIGIYFVAVRRGHRRSGFGAAVTWMAMKDGFDRGADAAVLQATTPGYPMYTGMGFTTIGDYRLWDIPAR